MKTSYVTNINFSVSLLQMQTIFAIVSTRRDADINSQYTPVYELYGHVKDSFVYWPKCMRSTTGVWWVTSIQPYVR